MNTKDGIKQYVTRIKDGLRQYTIIICDKCYQLEGNECHTPECVFFLKTMEEVKELLNILLIRPITKHGQLDFYPIEEDKENEKR